MRHKIFGVDESGATSPGEQRQRSTKNDYVIDTSGALDIFEPDEDCRAENWITRKISVAVADQRNAQEAFQTLTIRP